MTHTRTRPCGPITADPDDLPPLHVLTVGDDRKSRKAAVIGAGIIGLTCAWGLARAGFRVTVHDDAPGTGATFAAAGMLAPVSEAWFGEEELLTLSLRSARLWTDFARAVERASGVDVGYRASGTVQVALGADDARELERHALLLEGGGHAVHRLSSREMRRLEPAVTSRSSAGLLLPDEASVDPRRVVQALTTALARLQVRILPDRVVPLVQGGAVVGLAPAGAGAAPSGRVDLVVVAAGWQSPGVLSRTGSTEAGSTAADPARPALPIRPLKGQILRLRGEPGTVSRTIRATVHGRHVYLVPRSDGQVVVGATSEDVGADHRVTAGAVHDLLHDAITVVPELAELELEECTVRFRPATSDNLPLVGPTLIDGLLLASGHGRDGILLAPLTMQAIVAAATGAPPPPDTHHLAPQRFTTERTRR